MKRSVLMVGEGQLGDWKPGRGLNHLISLGFYSSRSISFSFCCALFQFENEMAAWTAAGRQASNLFRLSSSPRPASLIHRRGLAGGGDPHGPPKVNIWQDPLSPSKWKEEHFVIASLTGWGLIFYGGYKFFTKGKKDNEEEKVEKAAH